MSGRGTGKKKGAAGPFESLRSLKEELERKAAEAHAKRSAKKAPPAPIASAPSSRAPAADDDALLLHRLFAGVEPLDRSRARVTKESIARSSAVAQAAERGEKEAQAEAAHVREHLRALVEGQARFEVGDDGHHVEGRRIDVPHDALRQLRRGRLPIDARMDMHGMGVTEARARLDTFLRGARTRGERCVLVIHGKGAHSPGGTGILRGEIAAWLSQDGSSESVAAFATARREDGGEGAVYVLLRRT